MVKVTDLFPERTKSNPKIYAYTILDERHKGYIKIGKTVRDVKKRINEQTHTAAIRYKILGHWTAMRDDGSFFLDTAIHDVLRARGFPRLDENLSKNEWYKCSIDDVYAAYIAVRDRIENIENRTQNFSMRPEQCLAVEKTFMIIQQKLQNFFGMQK